jgi:hypothetical protein
VVVGAVAVQFVEDEEDDVDGSEDGMARPANSTHRDQSLRCQPGSESQ